MRFFKKIYSDLMMRFVFLVMAAAMVTLGFFVMIDYQVETLIRDNTYEITTINQAYFDYNEGTGHFIMVGERVEAYRYEVIKDYRVVYSEGPIIGGEEVYTAEDIRKMISGTMRIDDTTDYVAEYWPFTGSDGEPYAVIIKEPKALLDGKAEAGVNLPHHLRGTWVEKEISNIVQRTILIAVALLIVIALLISRLTTHKIVRPLRELQKGLKAVDDGHLDTRLTFVANEEFENVRDAFNRMTQRIADAEEKNEQLQESKKQFILDLSHDLRTPITTIQGYSQALSTAMVDDESTQQKYLQYIYNKSETMTKLINKLFEYSKLESASHQLKKVQHDMANCLRNVIIDNLDQLEDQSFEVQMDIPETQILFYCDATEMERAIGNIIGNQAKYNPNGTTVSYRLWTEDDTIIMTLSDDGIGIEEKVLDRIFDVMVRGDESRHGMDGTGLGLAITKRVVELHGGTVEVQSQVAIGTTFTLTFPL